jgi:hypothetical protein
VFEHLSDDDAVERAIGERQPQRIASYGDAVGGFGIDLCQPVASFFEVRRRHVDGEDGGAATGGLR